MTMHRYEIRQQPGPRAQRSAGRFGTARFRRVGTVREASRRKEALLLFVQSRYATNRQFVEYRLEWQSDRALGDRWNRDDHVDPDGRRWRAVVTLRNGRHNIHDIYLEAWKEA